MRFIVCALSRADRQSTLSCYMRSKPDNLIVVVDACANCLRCGFEARPLQVARIRLR